MASGPENRFIQGVHRALTPSIYRMKNHNQFNAGIADCWYSGRVRDYWIEYKFKALPKRDTTLIDLCDGGMLSILQQQWLEGRHNEGRNVGVILGTPDGGIWFPGTSFRTAITAGDAYHALRSKAGLAKLIEQLVN